MMRSILTLLAAMTLAGWGSAAKAEWRRFETAHFVIYSESDDRRVTELATGLESIDGLMRMATGLEDEVPVKVRIYELGDEGAVQAALGQTNSGIGGFYSSNALGPFAVTTRKAYTATGSFTGRIILHHEYAHHFMLQYFPATYPGWYVEGFAELIGATKILDDGRLAYGFPARHRGDTINADWVSMRDILLTPPDKMRPYDLYGQGWAMTHFLTFDPVRSKQLRQYLGALNSGKGLEAAAAAFGDLNALNRQAHLYLTRGQFDYRPVKVPVASPVFEKVSALGPAESAMIFETIAFDDGDLRAYRKDSARERERARREGVLRRIQAKVARYPSDPYAWMLLAQAQYAAGDHAAAGASADRLLALQPGSVSGLTIKSLALSQAAAGADPAARKLRAAEARALAVRANKAAPDDPMAYVAFYESYRAAGGTVPANAVEGLMAAVGKLPSDATIRQLLVDELIRQERWSSAIRVLSPLASSTHDTPLRQAAREKMAMLQSKLGEKEAKSSS
jgi:tetratricopeptide (TPR) repeat protein